MIEYFLTPAVTSADVGWGQCYFFFLSTAVCRNLYENLIMQGGGKVEFLFLVRSLWPFSRALYHAVGTRDCRNIVYGNFDYQFESF